VNAVIVCKQQYSDDLKEFALLLNKYGGENFSGVVSKLYEAESILRYSSEFKIDLDNIKCVIDKKPSDTIPVDIETITLYLEHRITLSDLDFKDNDPITDFWLQFEMEGVVGDDRYSTAWHLDKDIPIQAAAIQKYTHPRYHFQFGGRRIEKIDTGKALFLAAPRLPHPPMDIFLVVHFVIKNFFNAREYVHLYTIFEDFTYQEIIERAQDRFFLPYFSSLKKESDHNHFSLSNLFPLAAFD